MEEVIKFEHVHKVYKMDKREERNILAYFIKNKNYVEKKVLEEINFSIQKGERVVFLGKNGAGKSSILKMITGVSYPTEGNVIVKGKVNALLELNSGFEPGFTGRENIYLKGNLLGLKDSEIRKIEKDIIQFADIGEYIDYPIKRYSTGMKARLGFALAVHIEPEILVIDEALSVGDEEFKNKCLKKINDITSNREITLVFVTHSFEMARSFCKRGIVLEKGKITFDGEIEDALHFYRKTIKEY